MKPRSHSKTELVERVQAILAHKTLSLYQVSERTRALYGRSSPYFIPHNLYYNLGLGTMSPSLHQLSALSSISEYRLNDWLRVFGFHPEDIVRLQVLLASKRTMLLDSSLGDTESWLPWFRNRPEHIFVPPVAPLGQLLKFGSPRPLCTLGPANSKDFVYARVGQEDAFAYPNLLPGSIVRADTRLAAAALRETNRDGQQRLFLIEHATGLCCCRLQALGRNRFMPVSTELPYAQIELQLHEEVRVLGVLDLEIRSLVRPEQPHVPAELARHWRPSALKREDTKLSRWLLSARLRMGLSLREASVMSRQIARELGDEQYFTAPSSLSDYEALDSPPRHVHKAMTLCAVYGLHFSKFLKSIGVHIDQTGQDPMPENLVPRKAASGLRSDLYETEDPVDNGFLEQLVSRVESVPFFLRESLAGLSGMRALSMNDVFWVGGEQKALHPVLVNGLLVIVNRHRKRPFHFRSKPLWQQPLYILMRRDGTYLCACCSLENDSLVIHPYALDYRRPEQLRNRNDAEVVGEIVTIARAL